MEDRGGPQPRENGRRTKRGGGGRESRGNRPKEEEGEEEGNLLLRRTGGVEKSGGRRSRGRSRLMVDQCTDGDPIRHPSTSLFPFFLPNCMLTYYGAQLPKGMCW